MKNSDKSDPWKTRIDNLASSSSHDENKQTNFNNSKKALNPISVRTNSEEKQKITVKLKSNGFVNISPSSKQLSILLTKFSNDKVSYDLGLKEWNIHLDFYPSVASELKKHFTFYDVPKGIIEAIRRSWNMTQINFQIKQEISNVLLPFQREGVILGLKRNGRVLLADEMGLGKTYQALAITSYYELEWPMLIIAPASLLENWRITIATLLKMKGVIIKKGEDFGEKISIISYDMASKFIGIIQEQKFNVVIADECHYLKCAQAKRTTNLLPILQQATRLVMISGTPALSRPIELYTILMALDKKLFKSMSEYGYRYCNLKMIKNFFDWKGSSNLDELYYFMNECFMIRRRKDEVLSQLPLKSRRQVILHVTKSDRDLKKTSTEIINKLGNDSIDDTIIEKYREAAILKINPVLAYLKTMLDRKNKFIIFAHHQIMIDAIESILEKGNYIRIDGKTLTSSRQILVDKFQREENIQVALLSLTACCTGLTLTAARAVVFAELYWNPGTMLQAEDRAHRIGQKENVNVHYLTALGTVDEYVWPVLSKKLSVLEKMGIGTNQLKGITNVDANQESILKFVSQSK